MFTYIFNQRIAILCFMLIGLFSGTGFAHGVRTEVFRDGVGIQVFYSDDSPMSFSEVKIYSPDEKESAFQQGLTDRNGRFVFFPDKAGKWSVHVNDGLGHAHVEIMEIGEGLSVETDSREIPIALRAMTGISLLFGIAGISFYILVKKKNR